MNIHLKAAVLALAFAPSEHSYPGFGTAMVWSSHDLGGEKGELIILDSSPLGQSGGSIRLHCIDSEGSRRHIGPPLERVSSSPGAMCLVNTEETQESSLAVVSLDGHSEDTIAELLILSLETGAVNFTYRLSETAGISAAPAVYNMGDIDGIRGDELLIDCSYSKDVDTNGGRGQFRIMSLVKGVTIREIAASSVQPLADLNNDGCAEYVVTTVQGQELHSGKTGESLYTLCARPKGHPAEARVYYRELSDINGDEFGDVLQLETGDGPIDGVAGFYCVARALSGADGEVIWQAEPVRAGQPIVVESAVLTWRDTDEIPGVVVAYSGFPNGDDSQWIVYSGKNGQIVNHEDLEVEVFGAMTWGYSIVEIGGRSGALDRRFAISRATQRPSLVDGIVAMYSVQSGRLGLYGSVDSTKGE